MPDPEVPDPAPSELPPLPPPPQPDDPPPGYDEAGDAGKQAIDRMKAERNEAKREAQALKAELATFRTSQMSEHERAIEQARSEADAAARADVTTTTNDRLFRAEVKAAAMTDVKTADGKTVRLIDPSLLSDSEVARRLLGFTEIPVTDSGDIDAEAISAAMVALVAAKPHLAASATPAPGSADQGIRPNPASKDLETQIREAETAGDWATAGQLKLHKLAALPRP